MLHSACLRPSDEALVFRFHITNDPESFDPLHSTMVNSSYVMDAMYLPLQRYIGDQLSAGGAKTCIFNSPRTVLCTLNENLRFSNSEPILAEHYVHTFRQMFQRPSAVTEYFLALANSANVLANKMPTDQIGVRALSSHQLQFQLNLEDSDFIYRLTHPATSARLHSSKLDGKVTTGPYFLDKHLLDRKIQFKPNMHYPRENKNPPLVEALIVPNDETARHLFETKKLNFLRRLTFEQIELYKNRAGFFQTPFLRADYIGFNLEKVPLEVRRALSEAPNYPELQKLMAALGRPGCPTLPKYFFSSYPCLKKSQQHQLQAKYKQKTLSLAYSKQGGDDTEKAMQWFQQQWIKNTGLRVELRAYEQGVYSQLLNTDPPAIFRRGFNLSRPSCRALLESFTSRHPNNHLRFKNPSYDDLVSQMSGTQDTQKLKQFCQQGFEMLFAEHALIPLGEIYFSMIADSKFNGFKINSLNQLDLSELKQQNH